MTDERPDSIEEFTGDRAAAEVLRDSLRQLAERYDGHPLGQQIAEVLAGRGSMRELADDPEFASLAHEGMRKVAQEWAALSAEERATYVDRAGRSAPGDPAEPTR